MNELLLQVLIDRQKELDLIDADFAQLLGLSRPLWRAIKGGRREISLRLVRGALQAFPDLEPVILGYLRSAGN